MLCSIRPVTRVVVLGLLAVSCVLVAIGLATLSTAAGVTILLAATIYGIGQAFFWPTTLGLVAEQLPRGGALTLNAMAAVGMFGVGIVGTPLIRAIQDREIEATLVASVLGEPMASVLDPVRHVEGDGLDSEMAGRVTNAQNAAKRTDLRVVAILSLFMLVCYLGLIVYFRVRGGYAAQTPAGAHES